jgi:uncharacterized protein
MDDDQKQRPDSLLPYERWIEQALRHVVAQAIEHVAQNGLPGGHHFYITFRTDQDGVDIPQRVRAQYPREMTIVLQHQFWDLAFDRQSQAVSVGLSFGGVPAHLTIPLDAIVEFADPHIRYGLRFQAMPAETDAEAADPIPLITQPPASSSEASPDDAPDAAEDAADDAASDDAATGDQTEPKEQNEPAQVVSLDAFRRRSPQP